MFFRPGLGVGAVESLMLLKLIQCLLWLAAENGWLCRTAESLSTVDGIHLASPNLRYTARIIRVLV